MAQVNGEIVKTIGCAGVVLTGAAGVVGGIAYIGADKVRDRDAAYKTVRGSLVDAHVESGVKFDSWLPHVDYTKLPKLKPSGAGLL